MGEWILNEFTAADETLNLFNWWPKIYILFEKYLGMSEDISTILSAIVTVFAIAIPTIIGIIISKIWKWFKEF